MAGQAQAVHSVVRALPQADALALLQRRNSNGILAQDLSGYESPEVQRAAIELAAQELNQLAHQLATTQSESEDVVRGIGGPSLLGSHGRGGAVRRRKSGSESVTTTGDAGKVYPAPSSSDESKAAAAAGELLQLAAAASAVAPGRSRVNQPARLRDAKPYQRRGAKGAGRGGGRDDLQKDCWLPGGFWWQDSRTSLPTGRQPGELAGWAPMAGDLTQQKLQQEQRALSVKEHFIQGLGSRDDAAAYLQQLGHANPADVSAELTQQQHGGVVPRAQDDVRVPITRSVDDSDVEKTSAFKDLASWGGFRRQFVASESKGDKSPRDATAGAEGTGSVGHHDISTEEEWKRRLAEQLMAKRAEIAATQKKLESLSLEQQELEFLMTRTQ